LGIVVRKPNPNTPVQAINGRCLLCGYRLAWLVVRGEKTSGAGRHCSSFIPLRLFVLRPGKKKVARNAPKRYSSRLCCVGVFVLVVAQPI